MDQCVLISWCWLLLGVHFTSVDSSQPEGLYCTGKRQSPIDLQTENLINLNQHGIYWGRGFFEVPLTQELVSDNHTVVIKSTFMQTPYIAGGPLKDCYKLHSIHFHWASINRKGSEHTLNGQSYPMEMHVVFTRGNLTFEEAKEDKHGITVLGYFVDLLPNTLENRKMRNPFSIMAKTMEGMQFVNAPRTMQTIFSMNNLVIPFHYNYITYLGSLTTGDCNEVVTWIISPNVLKISRPQLTSFRSLWPRRLLQEPDNYRDVQPLNGRKVYFIKGKRGINLSIFD